MKGYTLILIRGSLVKDIGVSGPEDGHHEQCAVLAAASRPAPDFFYLRELSGIPGFRV